MGNAEMEKGVNEYLCLIIFADLRFCSVPRMGQLVNWCLRLPGLSLGPCAEVPKQPGGEEGLLWFRNQEWSGMLTALNMVIWGGLTVPTFVVVDCDLGNTGARPSAATAGSIALLMVHNRSHKQVLVGQQWQ